MIDSHAHLSDRFAQEVDLKPLVAVVLSASSQQDSLDNLRLAQNQAKLYPAVGIHPTEVASKVEDQLSFLENLLAKYPQIVAVGECGLEFLEPFDQQKQEELFRGQIQLAQKFQKPLIIHSREASDRLPEILGEYQGLRGVIHCYTGGKKRVKRFLNQENEWYFGLDGNLTYEVGLEQVALEIPKNRLLLETDSPFLTPIPHRGETNQPKYVKYIYEKMAEIWGLSFEETEEIIDGNVARLFEI
jgi:TatD DNase family protein